MLVEQEVPGRRAKRDVQIRLIEAIQNLLELILSRDKWSSLKRTGLLDVVYVEVNFLKDLQTW
jgi:hypothetical protein